MATIHTKNAIVYLQGSGAEAVELVEAGEVSLDIDFDLEADTAFGDAWETNLQGIKRWSGTISGNYDTTQATAFDAIAATTPRKMYVYHDRATSARYYYGTVWCKLGVQLPYGVAKQTINITGDGPLAAR